MSVISGDTIIIKGCRVVIHGIKAPSRNDLWYLESKDFLRKLVLDQTLTYKAVNGNTGIVLMDGVDVSPIIVENGWATGLQHELVGLENIAKCQKLGIYSENKCIQEDLEGFLDANKDISGTRNI
jgi:endonuclease YncB( thermonuclease family)